MKNEVKSRPPSLLRNLVEGLGVGALSGASVGGISHFVPSKIPNSFGQDTQFGVNAGLMLGTALGLINYARNVHKRNAIERGFKKAAQEYEVERILNFIPKQPLDKTSAFGTAGGTTLTNMWGPKPLHPAPNNFLSEIPKMPLKPTSPPNISQQSILNTVQSKPVVSSAPPSPIQSAKPIEPRIPYTEDELYRSYSPSYRQIIDKNTFHYKSDPVTQPPQTDHKQEIISRLQQIIAKKPQQPFSGPITTSVPTANLSSQQEFGEPNYNNVNTPEYNNFNRRILNWMLAKKLLNQLTNPTPGISEDDKFLRQLAGSQGL